MNMAEEEVPANDSAAVSHHLTKLSDVKKGTWAKDIHPSLSVCLLYTSDAADE